MKQMRVLEILRRFVNLVLTHNLSTTYFWPILVQIPPKEGIRTLQGKMEIFHEVQI
jgi:hypothetical protein